MGGCQVEYVYDGCGIVGGIRVVLLFLFSSISAATAAVCIAGSATCSFSAAGWRAVVVVGVVDFLNLICPTGTPIFLY